MKKRQDKTLSYIEKVSDEIIEALENGTAPWIKPWSGSAIRDNAPFNPITGKQYEGINFINLSIKGMAMDGDPRWMTFKQAQSLDAQVRKGEKGTAIQYWKFTKQVDKVDEDGKKILDKNNKPIKETIRLSHPQVFYATVFNASQIEGLRPLKEDLGIKEVISEFQPIEAAENILTNSNANIIHVAWNRAFYSLSKDRIQLPLKEQFSSEMDYYSTALHELGHWTGHESRLNRDMMHPFGSTGYAKEELRAEIGSYMLSSKIGIDFDPSQHHAYIEDWVSILEDKPSEIFKACSDASKIVSFVTKLQEEQKLETIQEETLKNEIMPKEDFSNIIEGAVTQMINKELKLDQLETALPTLIKDIELEQLQFAIIKTQDILLHHQIDEPVREEIKELATILTNIHSSLEKEYQQKIENENLVQEAKINNTIIQNDKELRGEETTNSKSIYAENTYLVVPYSEKDQAKKLGAKWDKKEKSWYAPKGSSINSFTRWSIATQEQKAVVATPISTQEATISFKEAIEAQGLILNDEPIMNGKIQRVPVIGDKQGKKSGAYVGYTDGVPAGFIQNHKTGTKENWKAIGYEFSNGLTKEDLERQKLINQSKRLERQKEQNTEHKTASIEAQEEFKNAKEATNEHPYLKLKGVKNYHLKVDDKGNLLMPIKDINGKHWTNQKINVNFKGFNKHGKKEGNFFIIGNQNLHQEKELIIVEGYSTGATIHEAAQKTVIVAIDSGNLIPVTETLDKKYPNSTILIAADNDMRQVLKGKENVGYNKALEAAKKTQRNIIYPSFSNEEIKANATDFNDLAKSKGLKEVKAIIEKSLEKSKILQQRAKALQKEINTSNQKGLKREVIRKISQGMSR
jgi:antirestriction protein ArdC/phage/plasmid primase-like uncharacterized protein